MGDFTDSVFVELRLSLLCEEIHLDFPHKRGVNTSGGLCAVMRVGPIAFSLHESCTENYLLTENRHPSAENCCCK